MLTRTLLILCALFAMLLLGCSKTETTTNDNAATGSKPATMSSPAMSTAGEKIGVPECDDFIAKYEACVSSKVPAMVRAQYQNSLKQWRASWKKLAESPNTKPTLAAACKQAAEQQEVALKAYGCKW